MESELELPASDFPRLLGLLGDLAECALSAEKSDDYRAAASSSLRDFFGCERAAFRTAVDVRTPAGAGALVVPLPAAARSAGTVELSGKPGGFGPGDRAALKLLAPHLAAHLALLGAVERKVLPSPELVQMEKLAAIGGLVASFTHEVRNPLHVIGGFADKLLETATEPETIDNLRRIRNAAARLERLVKNLLSFSRDSRTTIAPVDARELIETTLELAAAEPSWREIEIVKDFAKDPPQISGNINMLMQVFLNLIVNAQQAMGARGGGRLTISIRSDDARRRLEVEIADTGPGIPPEVLGRIFEPFFTTKGKAGTGLGLHIVSGIVENHRGKITVDSMVGKGTSFRVEFPALAI